MDWGEIRTLYEQKRMEAMAATRNARAIKGSRERRWTNWRSWRWWFSFFPSRGVTSADRVGERARSARSVQDRQ